MRRAASCACPGPTGRPRRAYEPRELNELVLVRHGETEWSRAGRYTGRTDLPLTEEGRAAARALGAALGARRFERVLTSPLARASDTARLSGFGDVADPRDGLREWDYGVYEGRTTKEIRRNTPAGRS